jgi:hypothetical protein
MNGKLQDLLAQRREAANRFCRMAAMEQNLLEKYLEDMMDPDGYPAWHRYERWLVAALKEYRRATDALITALEKRQAKP